MFSNIIEENNSIFIEVSRECCLFSCSNCDKYSKYSYEDLPDLIKYNKVYFYGGDFLFIDYKTIKGLKGKKFDVFAFKTYLFSVKQDIHNLLIYYDNITDIFLQPIFIPYRNSKEKNKVKAYSSKFVKFNNDDEFNSMFITYMKNLNLFINKIKTANKLKTNHNINIKIITPSNNKDIANMIVRNFKSYFVKLDNKDVISNIFISDKFYCGG